MTQTIKLFTSALWEVHEYVGGEFGIRYNGSHLRDVFSMDDKEIAYRVVECLNAFTRIESPTQEMARLREVERRLQHLLWSMNEIIEHADEHVKTIEFEVRERIQGSMYNEDDANDARQEISTAERRMKNAQKVLKGEG